MKSFSELSLSAPLVKAITEMGFETPSSIQSQAIPLLLEKPTDFIGLAATGTGKTAAFSIPMLEQIDPSQPTVQTLIMCPTRELALQVSGQINLLGKYKGVKALPIYGGASYTDQFRGLASGVNVVVGTPGRLVDHIDRGSLNLENLKQVILDEADEMISMGFKEDLEKVLGATNREESQIWLFSATMSREVKKVADSYLRNPVHVQVNKTEVLPATITQLYYITRESNKPEILCKMIDMAEDFYGIIFCQTKSMVSDLTQYLIERGYKVDSLHGDKDQKSRERTMQSFRDRKVKMLVCTDVASRGIDVKDITHVINYSLPRELDSYVHRIGRTARSGKEGFAMSLVTPAQQNLIYRLENMTKSRMQPGVVPTRKEVGTKKISQVLPKFKEEKFSTRALELLDDTWKEAISEMSKEEIAGRFLAMMNPGLFSEADRPQMPGPARSKEDLNSEFRRRDERRGGRRGDRGGRDYSGGRRDRDFGSEDSRPKRFHADRPRKDFSDEKPRRDFSEDKPRRQFDDAFPRKESSKDDSRPSRKDFGDSRPRRSFSDDKPKRKFNADFDEDSGFSFERKPRGENKIASGVKFARGPKKGRSEKSSSRPSHR